MTVKGTADDRFFPAFPIPQLPLLAAMSHECPAAAKIFQRPDPERHFEPFVRLRQLGKRVRLAADVVQAAKFNQCCVVDVVELAMPPEQMHGKVLERDIGQAETADGGVTNRKTDLLLQSLACAGQRASQACRL